MRKTSEAGQLLMIMVMLVLLILLAIPIVLFLNFAGVSHGVHTQKRLKGREIAEEGMAYAIQQLQRNPSAFLPYPSVCNGMSSFDGITLFNSIQGGGFSINCTKGPQNYEVTVRVDPKDTSLNPTTPPIIPGSSLQSLVSIRTVGAKLPGGMAAPAAIELGTARDFSGGGNIDAWYGPIVCSDSDAAHTWTVAPHSSSLPAHSPRKFSAGPMAPPGSTTPIPTDQKEYWTSTHVGVNDIDLATTYEPLAKGSTLAPDPLPVCALPCTAANQWLNKSSYFAPANGALLFDDAGGYAVTQPSLVFYVFGDAEFQRMRLDLRASATSGGAFIVTGNLKIDNVSKGLPKTTTVRVPPNAYLEFPTDANQPPWPPNPSWPCYQYQGTDVLSCTIKDILGGSGRLNYRGFLYVQGNMDVQDNFVMAGVLRVDGNLTITPGKTLTVIYDDEINRQISATPFELQVDSTTAVP